MQRKTAAHGRNRVQQCKSTATVQHSNSATRVQRTSATDQEPATKRQRLDGIPSTPEVQVQLLMLSGNVAASWELPGTTPLAELQARAEAALEERGVRIKILLPCGRLLHGIAGDRSLDSLL